jgi:4-hydroxy-3-polyprenylbenzoate decarboxylase
VYGNDDLRAPISSGSSPTVGMVILPCSMNTLGHIASGLGDNLIARAAHCHLKERRRLIVCLREAPLTTIDLKNASKIACSGGVIMPLSPPFYMFGGKDPARISMKDSLAAYVDRVLAVLGHPAEETWENRH